MTEETAPVERYAGITMTEAERDELAAIIYLEARGEPAEGQQAVAEVVLNRVIRQDFPDSVHEVLHQGRGNGAVPAFSTIALLETAEPTQAQYDAIDAALYGPSILPGEVVFFSRTGENDECGAPSGIMYSAMPTFGSDTMRNKKFKTACGAVSLAGFVILLGAAGGSDTGTLTLG